VGVVGAIVPWNFPLGLSFPKLAPALLAGCSVVLKAPEETPLFGSLLAEVFAEAGLPPGVVNVVAADREVSEARSSTRLVDKISFTGSKRAVRRIASLCGAQIKRSSLELGGKSAAIVLPDADLDPVIPKAGAAYDVQQRQTCMNQTRVLAHRERYADVVEAPGDDRFLPRRGPRGSRCLHRPADQRRAAPAGRGLHRQGPRRGRAARARRRPSRSRPRVTSCSRRSLPTSTAG
jgi:acyl-CoA reductase-like NAD-dependent aldehyde dehydrogenase